jgi:CheY-like chemotaxis protein
MVILDTLMPPERFGGIWAGQEIKRLRPETPLIFLSSYTQGQDIESVRQAGGMVLVNKELFAIPALIQAIFKAIWDWSLLRSLANERNIWFFEENLPLASGELVRMPVNRRERPV